MKLGQCSLNFPHHALSRLIRLDLQLCPADLQGVGVGVHVGVHVGVGVGVGVRLHVRVGVCPWGNRAFN